LAFSIEAPLTSWALAGVMTVRVTAKTTSNAKGKNEISGLSTFLVICLVPSELSFGSFSDGQKVAQQNYKICSKSHMTARRMFCGNNKEKPSHL
jgi:hypothetical protein